MKSKKRPQRPVVSASPENVAAATMDANGIAVQSQSRRDVPIPPQIKLSTVTGCPCMYAKSGEDACDG